MYCKLVVRGIIEDAFQIYHRTQLTENNMGFILLIKILPLI